MKDCYLAYTQSYRYVPAVEKYSARLCRGLLSAQHSSTLQI